MTTFYLVRHGEPNWASMKTRGLLGREENFAELTQKGVAQIEALSDDERLKTAQIIIASPYTRALQSAAILSRCFDLPLQVEYELHEWRFDPDPSVTYDDEMKRRWDEFLTQDPLVPMHEELPYESANELRMRAQAVLRKYMHHSAVIVVCHGGVIFSLSQKPEASFAEVVEYTQDSAELQDDKPRQ